jgi:TRAP-type C4-dicarboxylate transport system permease small subunit
MIGMKMVAMILVVAGVLALAYGGFTYTRETHHADIGALHMSVSDKKTVNVPIWVGAGAVIAGALLLVTGRKRASAL